MTLAERQIIWNRRKAARRRKAIGRAAIVFSFISLVFVCIILFFGKATASGTDGLHKYYSSMTVETGDTLWSIAESNIEGYDSVDEYIEEVVFINHLSSADEIKSGDCIIIPYYTNTCNDL